MIRRPPRSTRTDTLFPYTTLFRSSKAGVIGLTKSLGKELAGKGMTVNSLTPATFDSPILDQLPQSQDDYKRSKIPMGRLGNLDATAALVCFIASEDCSYTTASHFDTSGEQRRASGRGRRCQ